MEVREFEYVNWVVLQDGFGVFQDFSQFLCGNVVKVQNLFVIFDVVNRFQGCCCGFGEFGCYVNVGWNWDIVGVQQVFGFINQICFVQGFIDVVVLSGNEGVSDIVVYDQLVSDFRQGIQNGQFGGYFRIINDSDYWMSWFFQCFIQCVQFSGQQWVCVCYVSKFVDVVGGSLCVVCSIESVYYEYVVQCSVFFRQFFVVFFFVFVEVNVFQYYQFIGSYFYVVQVVFNQVYWVGQFVFQVINNWQQREFFVVFVFGWMIQVRSNYDFCVLFQCQFNGWQRCMDMCVVGYFFVFNWYVQICMDKNVFISQIQIGYFNYRYGEFFC